MLMEEKKKKLKPTASFITVSAGGHKDQRDAATPSVIRTSVINSNIEIPRILVSCIGFGFGFEF